MAIKGLQAMDRWARDWIGWSRSPLAGEPVNADPFLDWCIRCGAGVTDSAGTDDGCPHCIGTAGLLNGVIRLGSHEGRLRELVSALKYEGWWEVGDTLGSMLGLRVRDIQTPVPERTVVIPMPMPSMRRFCRGIDHARILAHAVSEVLGCTCQSLLVKSAGPTQVGTSRSQRERSGSGNMRLRRKTDFLAHSTNLEGHTIVLVDDVLTTGRTARCAGRALRQLKPSRILLAVLAVSEPKIRVAPVHKVEKDALDLLDP